MEEQTTRFEDLRLMPGQALQLEIDGYNQERDKAQLLGYRPSHSIIISAPMSNGVLVPLKTGMPLSVRLFAQQLNCACGFRTEVLATPRLPYPHLHLAMPKRLSLGEVRTSVRAKVNLISSVYYGAAQQKCSAIIKDLSLGGCRLQARALDLCPGDELKLTAQVAVSGIERIVTLSGHARSVLQDNEHTVIGVQFAEINDTDRITLHAYVLTHLHSAAA
ncbi:flagellar brake protein [Atopomonas sediminilitoris]|uniref:flagellar brake protein n=1 Tax=Atopomonas sediminilitoris TaxID=2919919 RepID=UPI001F4DED80|nr:flagellar brake protein [Atopomonas sediminilitoris]MCJ8169156.1 flagellar brake protein [Atopomonas sediminilitoris]